MEKQRKESLEAVLQLCGNLGAEIRYHPEYRYFTAMVWTGWDTPCGMGEALAIQQEIQRTAAQYPTVVCYCFDPFSTLVYKRSHVKMKQLGNLAVICAQRPELLMQLRGGLVLVQAKNRAAMEAAWNDDARIEKMIYELNFGAFSKERLV